MWVSGCSALFLLLVQKWVLVVSLISCKVLLMPGFFAIIYQLCKTLYPGILLACIFTIPQISFIQYYVPTGNIAVFGCVMWQKLEKCQTSTSYLFFLCNSDFLPREKTQGLTLLFWGAVPNISEMQSVLRLGIQQDSGVTA